MIEKLQGKAEVNMEDNQSGQRNGAITGQDLEPAGGRSYAKPGVAQVCILFSITITLFLFIGYRAQRWNLYAGLLITELGLIMLPAILFLLAFRFDLKAVLRLNGTKPLNYLIIFGIMLFALPIASALNVLNLLAVNSIFGKVIVQQPPVPQNGKELFIGILIIAGSAGLCEEFLFRGVIQRGLERFGALKAILLSAFLFSLTHMDFQKIFGTFLLGALIGLIVYRTNSLFCGMLAHFTNNALAVLISYASAKLISLFQGAGVDMTKEADINTLFSGFGSLPPQQLVIVLFIYGFIFLCLAAVFILLLYTLIRMNPVGLAAPHPTAAYASITAAPQSAPDASGPSAAASAQGVSGGGAKGLLWLLPGLLLIAGIYFIQVYNFTGVDNELVRLARQLLF